jgi:uncharacterized protein YkwD/uncharacterized membrane protein required for colicin V production
VNGIDGLVLLVLFFFAWHGFRSGVLARLAGLGVMALAIGIAWLSYRPVGDWLAAATGMSKGAATAAGFLLPFIVVELLATAVTARLLRRMPERVRRARWNHALGLVPGFLEGMLFAALALTVALVLPSETMPREAIARSAIGNRLVAVGTGVQVRLQRLLGDRLRDLLTFRTIEPGSEARVALPFRTNAARPDPEAEAAMLALINDERTRRGLKPLRMDEQLREVARRHSRDMLRRGYFGHLSPEGVSPFERMTQAGVSYVAAGENLALAPTVEIAHAGLMQSPGHRANILQPRFGRVGIGALAAPPYGIMFTQVFAD